MSTVKLELTDKKYDIIIEPGSLKQVGTVVEKVWTARQVLLVSDSNVAKLYLTQVQEALMASGYVVTTSVVPAGEASKSLNVAQDLYRVMLDQAFTRSDGVIALGGGVVGDLAGFVASTFMRGISFIQLPTSLLAQVDSSVGGKTAVDFGTGKNLVGTFYQPDLVLIDPDTLQTLTPRYVAEGYAEVIKMAATAADPAFWPLIESIQKPADILKQATALITHSVQFKAMVVMNDEKETGMRQILNFGHTLGHAIELLAQGKLAHGEAVAIGMVQICRIFEAKGLTPAGTTAKIQKQVSAVGLPVDSPLLFTPKFYDQLRLDKKNRGDHLNFIYLKALGQPAIYPVAKGEIKDFIASEVSSS
ncbi:MAG: 3-dehydroquinate synthase [Lactobacillus sp.]|jgi:3-dehydroquinate synthase|nr:3-dehydroquinate synthase [Lactobacillus sp.]